MNQRLCSTFLAFALSFCAVTAAAYPRESSSGAAGVSNAESLMWYAQLNGQASGPFTADQVGAMLNQGIILPQTPVAKVGAGTWRPAAHAFAEDDTILALVADGPIPSGGKNLIPPGIIFSGVGAVLFLSSFFFCNEFGVGTDAGYIEEDKQCVLGFTIAAGVFLLGGGALILGGVSRNVRRRQWLRENLFPGTFQLRMTRATGGLFWQFTF